MYTTRITRSLQENPGARMVRTAVFMEEQGYKNEFDDHDAEAVHLCIYDGEEGIATARSYRNPEGVWVLGRVAVLRERRGQRLGSRAVQELEGYLHTLGARGSSSPPSCMPSRCMRRWATRRRGASSTMKASPIR